MSRSGPPLLGGTPEPRGPRTTFDSDYATHGDYLPQYGDHRYRTTSYDLALECSPGTGRITARATISAVAGETLSEVVFDLGRFRITKVLLDSASPARYTHRADKLRIRPIRPLPMGAVFTVEVRYTGVPRPIRSREWGELGWEQLAEGSLVASQPYGAHSWYPCNDRPDDKARYRIAVTAPSPYTVVANGRLISRTVRASTTTWVYDQPAPMAAYLAAVHIGPYALVTLSDAVAVPQRAAVPRELLGGRFEHDFARQPRMMAVFQDLFGPYPFDEYAVVVTADELEVPIEAQGLSAFGANHVDGHRGSERLIAHELAHQWFGNSLTAADWRDIWLHEGFAKYAEWLWSELSGGPNAAVLAGRAWGRLALLRRDILIADPGPDRLFDERVYERGGLTLHALRHQLGLEAFVALLREWTATHRHGSVTTEQFLALADRHSPQSLERFFQSWLYERELPALPDRLP
ncbi:M1 family metallopeptidase [Streptomyces albipurpureus]|uniref:Aminopeptidase N n=1 Tax=Streptomyces albipurpureus TaxID=2897419 RepID=A0ABT0V1B1_9ACTN|nr:M1 family metallopeptidase [Streptomyces sp. CWNU-1]MCM2393984.1 M1 family metallopeptidase [Streptomyces sp. CWNU-1]